MIENGSAIAPLSDLSGRKLLLFRILLFGILPFAILVTGTYRIAFTPADTETISRFIKPFMFMDVSNISWAASESYFYGIVRPLYGLSFFADFSLWGTSFFYYHLTDLFLSWIIFLMAYSLFRRRFSRFVSVIAVSIWAVLPLQSYSLVTLVGRNDRLMTLFILGALLAYDRALTASEGRRKWLLLSLLIFTAGAFSKESIFYYSLFLVSWSVIVAGRKIIDTLRRDFILWGGIVAVAVLYFSVRLVMQIPMGNPTVYNSGVDYLILLGQMISWGFPVTLPASFLPFAGLLSLLVPFLMIFSRRIPADIRYGIFCLFIGFFHIPVFWIQKCFLWLPWLFGSLAVAGILSFCVKWAGKKYGRAGNWAGYVLTAVIIALCIIWSRRTIGKVVHLPMVFNEAAAFIIENTEKGDYSLDILQTRSGLFGSVIPSEDTPLHVRLKNHVYIENLIQLRLGNPDAELEHFSRWELPRF